MNKNGTITVEIIKGYHFDHVHIMEEVHFCGNYLLAKKETKIEKGDYVYINNIKMYVRKVIDTGNRKKVLLVTID